MSPEQHMVREFHQTFGHDVGMYPQIPDVNTVELRAHLMDEEYGELLDALSEQELPAIAKELADLLYVVYGTAVSYGIDLAPVFAEVHRSNMSKVGGYRRADGKWVKPATYAPAHILPILAAQQGEQ